MKNTVIPQVILFILAAVNLSAIDDVKLHLKVIGLEIAAEPEIYFNQILFTAMPEENTRHVGIAFAQEDFQTIHSFQKNPKGVFFFIMDIPSWDQLDYRLIIDGIWQLDPHGVEIAQGVNGIALSSLTIPDYLQQPIASPVVHHDRRVEFTHRDVPGRMVYLSGSFNQWDPYLTKMEEVEPGVYSRTLRLPRGPHYYNFLVNGESLLDQDNPVIMINEYGQEVSGLEVP